MSALRVAATLVAILAAASARPSDNQEPAVYDIKTVVNKTMCPIKIEINEDAARVPKRIKLIKCADDLYEWCSAKDIPTQECCHLQHGDLMMECMEVQDLVQVFFPANNETQQLKVSVGCACVMQRAALVQSPNPGDDS